MKRITAFFVTLIMALGFSACGNEPSASADLASSTEGASQPDSGDAVDSGESTANTVATESGNALVIYYSATGNTKEVANYIADAISADLFELKPKEPYTDADLDWTDEDSRVSSEHDNPDARNVELVADTVDNWASYDTVFIGYPIWWGIAAWPVDGFIKANDFTGKTVIPFCTSSSSDMGESGHLLEEMAGTGDWMEGQRFTSRASEEDIRSWLDGLELVETAQR